MVKNMSNLLSILIIVHLFDGWAGSEMIKKPIMDIYHSRRYQTYSLYQHCWKGKGKKIKSSNGECFNNVKDREVVICGLYFGACLGNTIRTVANGKAKKIILPMKAIAHSRNRTLYDDMVDNFNGNEERFINEYIKIRINLLISRKFTIFIKKECIIIKFEKNKI